MPNIAFFRALVVIALSLCVLTACTPSKLAKEDNWLQNMPPRSYFIDKYNADTANADIQSEHSYLTWVVRFYNGSEFYSRGWIKMTNELMEQVSRPEEADEIRAHIDSIGQLVAAEWAKKIGTRKVVLRHVSVWGNALLESIERDQTLDLVKRVHQDVEQLLEGQLSLDAITADRYFAPDEDDPFS